MNEILNYSLFALGEQNFTIGQLFVTLVLISVIVFVYRSVLKVYFPKVFQNTEIGELETKNLVSLFRGLAILCLILAVVISLNLDLTLYARDGFKLTVALIIKAVIFLQVARLLNWLISNLFIHNYYSRRDSIDTDSKEEDHEKTDIEHSARQTIKRIFFAIAGLYLLNNFQLDIPLFVKEINGELVSIRISNLLQAFLILLFAKLFIWVVTQLVLYNVYKNKKVNIGSRFAINQLIKYVVYVFATVIALDVFGINMNILLGGAAALLVGIGLGLQQTFNDFISGIVLLFERRVSVGNVLEVEGEVGTVTKIGLRSSTLETRGNVSIVLPNHKLVNEKVINWNHVSDKVRFSIDLGVAYGSDTSLVKKLLLQAINDNPYIINYPAPFVRFQDFGESSLSFNLFFFSRNVWVIEDIKSDIRLEIDRLFRENDINIPFPQREIRIINEGPSSKNP